MLLSLATVGAAVIPEAPWDDPFWPQTTDATVLMLRPPSDGFAKTYEVGAGQTYATIGAAFTAVQADRNAAGISGLGPQDMAGIRIHPGDYNERMRPPTWSALVSSTGNPADVRVWADMDDGNWNPVLNPTGSTYVEGVTLQSYASFVGDPGAGQAPATLWQINAAPFTSVTLVKVISLSDNEWCNSGAFQPGDSNYMWAYQCEFHMAEGSQPFNVQTAQAWRSTDPDEASDIVAIDCTAHGQTGLVAGLADLGYGAHDRLIWSGGQIDFDPATQDAAFFYAPIDKTNHPERPYACRTWCDLDVTFAGDPAGHTWGVPSDLWDSAPVGGLGPRVHAAFHPQALTVETTIAPPLVTAGTGTPTVNRWYFLPITITEAYNLRGATQQVTTGATGQVKYGIWTGATPKTWRTLGAAVNLAPGTVTMSRGTYKNTRLYPGETLWLGVCFTGTATVPMDTGLAGSRPVYYQDNDGSVPASPTPVLLPSGTATPITSILTGPNP